MHDDDHPGALRTWLSTLPALFVLLVSVAQGSSELVQARMLALGEEWWPGYAELRTDPVAPTCDPEAIGNPAAAPAGGAAPSDDVDLDALMGGGEAPNAEAVAAAKAACVAEHDRYQQLQASITPGLRRFRSFDHVLSAINDFGHDTAVPLLVLLILIASGTASALGAHIALRDVQTRRDHLLSEGFQAACNLLAALSFAFRWRILTEANLAESSPGLALVWTVGFVGLAGIALVRLARPPADLPPGTSWSHAFMSVPLYAYMGVTAAAWFFLAENHPSGLAIFVDKLVVQADLYLQVGLFVWAGMLLKNTTLPRRVFDVLRPWRMPPEVLACVILAASAIPTAYTGASGIFVIAAGAVIYEELRRAGARNELAIAVTAMSGSFGVVLSPCLLVVIVAALNKQVTTTELFDAGRYVFVLTIGLVVVTLLLTRRNPLRLAPAREALPASLRGLLPLLPYLAILVAVIVFYRVALHTQVDEHSASRMMLVVLLAFVLFEGSRRGPDPSTAFHRVARSTTATTLQIGSLLAMMTFSVGFGGIVERAEVMSLFPQDLGGPWPAMAVLVVVLIVVGMLMDEYGAVILVSATIAEVAYRNGITPLHFWVTVLVSFELGYLAPPVALNQLITRLVIGPAQADLEDWPADAGFWARHERYLLPMAVMTSALVLVAFVPLAFGGL